MERLKTKRRFSPTEGPILSSMILFALPIVCSSLLSLLYQSMDLWVLSFFSATDAIASVGSTTSIVSLFLSICSGLGAGIGILFSKAFGKKDKAETHSLLSTSIVMALALGLAVAAIGVFAIRPLLILTNCPEECLSDAILYARTYILGTPFILLSSYSSSAISGSGNSRYLFLVSVISGVVNMSLNVVFALILPNVVLAVALATVCSTALNAVLYLRFITRPDGAIGFSLRGMRFSFRVFRDMLRYGLPAMFTLVVSPLVNMQIQSAINSHGADAIAGNTACMQFENLISYVVLALSSATLTFMGQNIGAGKPDRVRRVFFCGTASSMSIAAALVALILIFSRPLLSIYVGSSAAAVEFGAIRMRYVLLFFIVTSNPMNVAIRAFGQPQWETGVNLFFSLGFRTIWMQFIYPIKATIEALYLCFPVTYILTQICYVCILTVLFRRYNKSAPQAEENEKVTD